MCKTRDNRRIQAEREGEKNELVLISMMTNGLTNFQLYDIMNLGVS